MATVRNPASRPCAGSHRRCHTPRRASARRSSQSDRPAPRTDTNRRRRLRVAPTAPPRAWASSSTSAKLSGPQDRDRRRRSPRRPRSTGPRSRRDALDLFVPSWTSPRSLRGPPRRSPLPFLRGSSIPGRTGRSSERPSRRRRRPSPEAQGAFRRAAPPAARDRRVPGQTTLESGRESGSNVCRKHGGSEQHGVESLRMHESAMTSTRG